MKTHPELPFSELHPKQESNSELFLKYFGHERESTPANEAIYRAQKKRLSLNGKIILRCYLEGQHITSLSAYEGLKHEGMDKPKQMTELHSDGHKEFWIDFGSVVQIREKFKEILF